MPRFLATVKIQAAGLQFPPGGPALQRLMKEAQEFEAGLGLIGLQSQENAKEEEDGREGFGEGGFGFVDWYQCPWVREHVMAVGSRRF